MSRPLTQKNQVYSLPNICQYQMWKFKPNIENNIHYSVNHISGYSKVNVSGLQCLGGGGLNFVAFYRSDTENGRVGVLSPPMEYGSYICLCMTTLTEVLSCFFLSSKAKSIVKLTKTGHGPHSSKICLFYYFYAILCIFVLFYLLFVLFYLLFVLFYLLFVLFYLLFVLFYLLFVLFYVLFVLCRSLYCLCVYVYCTTATGWLPKCS
jgi:hypothetical protein